MFSLIDTFVKTLLEIFSSFDQVYDLLLLPLKLYARIMGSVKAKNTEWADLAAMHWPPEVFDKIFKNIEETSTPASLSYIIQIMNALEKTPHSYSLSSFKNKMVLIDLTGAQSKEELCRVSRCAKTLLSENNFMLLSENLTLDQAMENTTDKRIVFVTNNDVEFSLLEKYLHCCTDVIFCCDCLSSLENGPIGRVVSAIANEAVENKNTPKHLVVDFPKDTLIFTGRKLLGFLDGDFLENINEYEGILSMSVPNVVHLNMSYTMLDEYTASFQSTTNSPDYYSYSNSSNKYIFKTKQKAIDIYLFKFRILFLDLTEISFVNQLTSKRCCNSINLSHSRLERFQKGATNLKQIFEIYSLTRWEMPQLAEFPGHKLCFDGVESDGNLGENLSLLSNMTAFQKNDSPEYYSVKLFPEVIKKSRLINWVADGFNCRIMCGLKENKVPLLRFELSSLEILELKPLVPRSNLTVIIQGLYLPNLKILSLTNDEALLSESGTQRFYNVTSTHHSTEDATVASETQRTTPWSKIEYFTKSNQNFIRPIFLSDFNELPNCEKVDVSRFAKKKAMNLLSMTNLKRIMPKIDLEESFYKELGDERQVVIL